MEQQDSAVPEAGEGLQPGEKSATQLKKEAKKKDKLEKFQAKKEKVVVQPVQLKTEDKTKVKKEENEDDFMLDPEHVPGAKKNTAFRFPPSYRREYVEAHWYSWWEKEGFFKPEYMEKLHPDVKEKFVMVIPPPNVTGTLHLGHALTNAVEDTLSRWHRMCGKPVLWVPGCDHAGIATQVVVEKQLAKVHGPGFTRHQLGREKFVDEVWKWKNEKGEFIYNQIRRMGSSVDWSRTRFTMEPVMSRAVTEAFVRLHDDGTIYRSRRLVNWSCTLKSCISDIEVEKRELPGKTFLTIPGYANKIEFGVLISFAYPIEDSTEEIVVATTRIETMLGDTGIAVHPDDERFKSLIGKFALHPFLKRKLPIVADKEIDMAFGTGAVKITPAHDQNDYVIGQRNNLDVITILKEDGTLRDNCGDFSGMKRFDARKAVLDSLKEKKLYRGTTENPMVVPVCSRSKDVVEPLLMAQWFVDCKDMAQQALDVVESKKLRLIPDVHVKIWEHWLVNIRDWCISRQLWWGHRIPAYLVSLKDQPPADDTEKEIWISGRSLAEVKEKASKRFGVSIGEITVLPDRHSQLTSALGLYQDEDVLDTWFSSALFPFSVFAWPDETSDLQKYYPTSLLETGSDILFFWVARMVMIGLKLTGQLPFTDVYLHSIVRDAHGRKMTKSLGNVIDPVDVIEGITLEALHEQLLKGNLEASEVEKAKKGQKEDFPDGIPECGTDALRFGLCAGLKLVGDINLDINVIQGYRFFCNKLWNALRFAMLHSLGAEFKPLAKFTAADQQLSHLDLWILSRAAHAVKECDESFRDYDLARMTRACHGFWLYDLCDVYLECCKAVFGGDHEVAKEATRQTLYTVLDVGLRLISPMMPFISEELYQRMPRRNPSTDPPSICVTLYPRPAECPWTNEELQAKVDLMMKIVNGVRSLRADYNFKKSEKVPLFISCRGADVLATLKPLEIFIRTLTTSSEVEIALEGSKNPEGGSAILPIGDKCTVILSLKNIDAMKELERLSEKLDKLALGLDKLSKAMAAYSEKVPQDVRLRDAEKMQQQLVEKNKIEEVMSTLKKLL